MRVNSSVISIESGQLEKGFFRSTAERLVPIALCAIALVGCGDDIDGVAATEWGITVDQQIMEMDWVDHTRTRSLPSDVELRDVDTYRKKTGDMCVSYDSNMSCTSKIDTYSTFHDYTAYEPVVARDCPADIITDKDTDNISRDDDCMRGVEPSQWTEEDEPKYWIEFDMPADNDSTVTCRGVVSRDVYEASAQGEPILTVSTPRFSDGCEIKSVAVTDN